MEKLTIKEILEKPIFRDSEVITENADLDRAVRWVHVLEVTNFQTLINGEEMILSTGVAFGSEGVTYLQKLVENNVSCLCIELGSYISEVPREMVNYANEYNFPIIVFNSTVKFIDISQEINSELLNKRHHQLNRLNEVSNEFNQLSVDSKGTQKILKKLREVTHEEIIFIPGEGDPYALPRLNERMRASLDEIYEKSRNSRNTNRWNDEENGKTYIVKRIEGIGEVWGVIIMSEAVSDNSFLTQVLDRAANALAQNLIRLFHNEEQKIFNNQEWVYDLIEKRINNERDVIEKLKMDYNLNPEMDYDLNPENIIYRIMIIKILDIEDPTHLFRISRQIRKKFLQYNVHPFITLSDDNHFVILAVNNQASHVKQKKDMLNIRNSITDTYSRHFKIQIGGSQIYTDFLDANSAFKEAEDVLKIIQTGYHDMNFYEDIGVYQLLLNLDENILNNYLHSQIHPLISHDKNNNLLHTLDVWAGANYSKKEAAQKLYISRHTLYYRLDKIYEILQKDLDDPHVRTAVKVALLIYKLNKN